MSNPMESADETRDVGGPVGARLPEATAGMNACLPAPAMCNWPYSAISLRAARTPIFSTSRTRSSCAARGVT